MTKFNGPHTALTNFRNCFEASMTFEEALGCAGFADKDPAVIDVMRFFWDTMERNFAAKCRAEETLRA
jgi:hypothetical protein